MIESLIRIFENFFQALRSMGIFTRTIEEEKDFLELWADVMLNSVKHLSWARYTFHRCETCTFKSGSQVTVLVHMDRGHMNFRKKTIACAFRHKPRVSTNRSNAFQSHMLRVHKLEVSSVWYSPVFRTVIVFTSGKAGKFFLAQGI